MSNVITSRVDDDVLARLDRIAAEHDRTRAWVIQRLLADASLREIDFLDFIQAGLDDVEAGRTIPHDEFVTRLRTRWAKREAA